MSNLISLNTDKLIKDRIRKEITHRVYEFCDLNGLGRTFFENFGFKWVNKDHVFTRTLLAVNLGEEVRGSEIECYFLERSLHSSQSNSFRTSTPLCSGSMLEVTLKAIGLELLDMESNFVDFPRSWRSLKSIKEELGAMGIISTYYLTNLDTEDWDKLEVEFLEQASRGIIHVKRLVTLILDNWWNLSVLKDEEFIRDELVVSLMTSLKNYITIQESLLIHKGVK